MKSLEKIIIVALILAPIIWGYVSLKPYFEDDDMIADIIEEGNTENITQTENNEVVQDEIETIINNYEGEIQGEKYISTIGNPVGKIVMGGEINISVANVYLEPDETSEVVDTITKHSIVTSHAYPGGWSRVKNETVSGWMKSEHITLPPDSGDVTIGSVIGRTGAVNVDSLNMRASGSKQAKIISSLTMNTNVTILEISKDGDWYKVKYGTKEGWVSKDYLTIK